MLTSVIESAKQAWVFQWNPEEYDTINDFSLGKRYEPWRVNAHWTGMNTGDIALLWKTQSGTGDSAGEAGIYGIARLIAKPYPAPPDDVCKYRVKLEYLLLLPTPLLKSILLKSLRLKSLALRIAQGSNFRVESTEWEELKNRLLNFSLDQMALQKNGTPKRRIIHGNQIVRDSKLVIGIKENVQNKCQVCGVQITIGNGKYYSEGHHIKPLGMDHQGVDDEDNIIILCPNHHAEFDYGAIAIDPSTLKLLHLDSKNEFHSKPLAYARQLNKEYLRYHIDYIFRSTR